ncbi:MAG: hypothetical protein K7J15_04305 [Candidatus Regiella insecticola]|nr:hypothetical protein [Candidatus Regiella insecticola]
MLAFYKIVYDSQTNLVMAQKNTKTLIIINNNNNNNNNKMMLI